MNKSVVNPVLIAIAVIAVTAGVVLASFMLSRFMLKIQHSTEKCITVKGVAEKMVMSDVAAFFCSVSVKGNTQAAGYAALDKARKILVHKLNSLGFPPTVQEEPEIKCEKMYRTETVKENGKSVSRSYFDHYKMTFSTRIRTSDVQKVSQNVLKLHELVLHNVNIAVGSPQYFINNPEQYKLELVDSASASAAARASAAAQRSGSSIGPLIEARQGVIQITAPASNETSDYGIYDTGSPQKVIRLVMTMKFSLK